MLDPERRSLGAVQLAGSLLSAGLAGGTFWAAASIRGSNLAAGTASRSWPSRCRTAVRTCAGVEALLGAQGQQRLAQRRGPGVGGTVATVAARSLPNWAPRVRRARLRASVTAPL